MVLKIYLAGPMTGVSLLNFPAFNRAAAALRDAGHEVVNPAELDIAAGIDPEHADPNNTFHMRRDAMARDLPKLVDCDAIAYLPGSSQSAGCQVEGAVARYLALVELNCWFDTDGQIQLRPHM